MTIYRCPVCSHQFLKPFLATHVEREHPSFDMGLLSATTVEEVSELSLSGPEGIPHASGKGTSGTSSTTAESRSTPATR